MKKLVSLIALLLIAPMAFGGTVTFDSATTSTFSVPWLNQTLYKLYNVINGSLDTNNFATGAVASKDLATPVNILIRENELIGEVVISGLTIATSATLTSTITAGVAYVENDGDGTLHRVVTADTSKTFTASKDTWVYLAYTGAFYYNEQALGASQPTTPDNYILLAKVTTTGVAVSSVTDYRQTTPSNLRIYEQYVSNVWVSRDTATATKVTLGPGEIEFGSSVTNGKRKNTATTDIDFSVVGVGGLDVGAIAANTWYYLFAIADTGNSTNFKGIASLSSSDATGVTGERLVGWCYTAANSTVSNDACTVYKGQGSSAPMVVSQIVPELNPAVNNSPANTLWTVYSQKVYTSGRPCKFTYYVRSTDNSGTGGGFCVLSIDGAAVPASEAYWYITTQTPGGRGDYQTGRGVHYQTLTAGQHTIELKAIQDEAGKLKGYGLTTEEM